MVNRSASAQAGDACEQVLPPGSRIVVIANGLFGKQLAGGDIHLLHSIKAFLDAGWDVRCLSGHVLARHLQDWGLRAEVICTDSPSHADFSDASLVDKLKLFVEFVRRFFSAVRKRRQIGLADVAFSPTDFWFDVLPLALSRARMKIVILQMKAPSLKEVILRSRPDVEVSRVASLHYCFSQRVSLAVLRRCANKRVVCVQPLLQSYLRQQGYTVEETPLIPNGVEVALARMAEPQPKQFDLVWMGRVHRQKGIEDLMETLEFLSQEIAGFRAVLIGNLRERLGAEISRRGLESCVEFAGFASGVEKFRWLKRARVFVMPSWHEGLPIVVGEALACGLPVVAYELGMYRPFFGDLLYYVRPFDVDGLRSASADLIRRSRAGEILIDKTKLSIFLQNNSWESVEKKLAKVPVTAR